MDRLPHLYFISPASVRDYVLITFHSFPPELFYQLQWNLLMEFPRRHHQTSQNLHFVEQWGRNYDPRDISEAKASRKMFREIIS